MTSDAPGNAAPCLVAPPGACDTHLHFYDPKFMQVPGAATPPAGATADAYRALQQRLGLTRAVIVQPSAYGKDNRCTVAGIAALGIERTRGIAVADTSVTDTELASLTQAGIRGVRFLMLGNNPALPWQMLDEIAHRVQRVGWHVQLQLDGRTLPEREAQIMRWPGTIVIDHNGKFLEPVAVNDPAFACLLRILDSGRVWVKLSAPYETSKAGPPRYEDVGRLARALVKAAPERTLWASNWPHPSVTHAPDDAALLDLLLDWAPDSATRQRILVDNPAELYGF